MLQTLARLHPPPQPLTDPLAIIVWDNIGYLISDDRRAALFAELVERVGLTASAIAAAPDGVLIDIARRGGMRPEDRAARLRRIGALVEEVGGDLDKALRGLPLPKARALLKRFPGVGDPGADKVLLLSGIAPRPALESNGVRVLVRMGYAQAGRGYAQGYRSATDALSDLAPPEREHLVSAYQTLRAHGQALCRRATPLCTPCPLDEVCAHASAEGL